MKTCYMCKYIEVNTAQPDYSEYTPGSSFDMSCSKGHWSLDPWEDTEEQLYECLCSALKCADFEYAEYVLPEHREY